MRIGLVDSLLESHVIDTLADALRARGHEVLVTGKLSHGDGPVEDGPFIGSLRSGMAHLNQFGPDLVLLFRPQSWPVEYSKALRRRGVKVVAWLSDGPVLLKSGYGRSLEEADVVLVCGHEPVLQFFDSLGLFEKAVNFPFWAAVPEGSSRVKNARRGVFLGNVNGAVRGRRTAILEKLGGSVKAFGQASDEQRALINWGGVLRGRDEIHGQLLRSQIGLNFPQFYSDYAESKYWFEGLEQLGGFQTPSRVVQYAAAALPVITLGFPGIGDGGLRAQDVLESVDDFQDRFHSFTDAELRRKSKETFAEYNQHFTAEARAEFLEWLIRSPDYSALSASQRATLYRDFKSISFEVSTPETSAHAVRLSSDRAEPQGATIFGDGWSRDTSALHELKETVSSLHMRVTEANPFQFKNELVSDPLGDFEGLVSAKTIDSAGWLDSKVIFIVGTKYGFTKGAWAAIRSAATVVCVIAEDVSHRAATHLRLGARADHVLTVRPETADVYYSLGVNSHALYRLSVKGKESVPGRGLIEVSKEYKAESVSRHVSASELLGSESSRRKIARERPQFAQIGSELSGRISQVHEILRFFTKEGVGILLDARLAEQLRLEPISPNATLNPGIDYTGPSPRSGFGLKPRFKKSFKVTDPRAQTMAEFVRHVAIGDE